jgi:hypothetical protein
MGSPRQGLAIEDNVRRLADGVNWENGFSNERRAATPCLAIKRHGPLVLLARHCLINSRLEVPVAPNDEQSTDVAVRHLA